MNIKKICRTSILLLLILTFVLNMTFTAFAQTEAERIKQQIKDVFTLSKKLAGVSTFYGDCSYYVACQLYVLGLNKRLDYVDGNQMYYKNYSPASGVTATKYKGSNCLYNIVKDYGKKNVYNIVVSWSYEYRASYENPGHGHCMFIHAIINNMVYYSESYRYSNIPEGAPDCISLDTFMKRYIGMYGNPVGAIVFSTTTPPKVVVDTKEYVCGFKDVEKGKWYSNAVEFCYNNGYMVGTADKTFSPNLAMTRAQAVCIMAKMQGINLSEYSARNSFKDVAKGKWYHDSVEWAYDFGISSGVGEGNFNPNGQLTRQELCVMLYGEATNIGYSVITGDSTWVFSDYNDISDWAKLQVAWAYEIGLISGTGENKLSPKAIASRSQMALIVMNFYKSVLGE